MVGMNATRLPARCIAATAAVNSAGARTIGKGAAAVRAKANGGYSGVDTGARLCAKPKGLASWTQVLGHE